MGEGSKCLECGVWSGFVDVLVLVLVQVQVPKFKVTMCDDSSISTFDGQPQINTNMSLYTVY